MSVTLQRVRAALGRHRLVVLAFAFVLLSVLLFRTEILSSVRWTGTAVPGSLVDGIIYYGYKGHTYSLDYTSTLYSHTVYLDPRDPDDAVLGARWGDFGEIALVVAPLILALILVALDVRQLRSRRRARARSDQAGYGLDVGYIRRLNESRRNG